MYLEISLYNQNKIANKIIIHHLYDDGFRYHNNNNKWVIKGSKKEIKKLRKKYNKYGQSNTYDDKYARNRNYRKKFFQLYSSKKYRCAYCGKKLHKEMLVIDHIISVNKVQTSIFSKLLLKLISKNGVNDYNNLVCCCQKCNLKKGTKTKLKFIIRGITGKYPFGITIRRTFKLLTIVVFITYILNIVIKILLI